MANKEECEQMLKNLVNKKHLLFVRRGNTAIKLSLLLAKSIGRKKILLQNQGGWITYPQYADKLKLEKIFLKTDYGIILPNSLVLFNDESALLFNSAPAYAYLQPADAIVKICKEKNILLINDCTGSIGTEAAKHGDIIFGSVGKLKPINLGHGAFIATNNQDFYKFLKENNSESSIDFENLYEKLSNLDKRLNLLTALHKEIKQELKDFDIVHRKNNCINVIVKYSNEQEKKRLIKYCQDKELEYTECPRYIRINESAISIEVKRK